jgi:UDPglucose 6-dehydrogenase
VALLQRYTLIYDIDQRKIDMLSSEDRDTIESCLFEQGLGDLLVRNKERIHFTTDYTIVEAFLETAQAVFMCLPTPEINETGETNLQFYFDALYQLSGALKKRNQGTQSTRVIIVNRSTVPIDTIDKSMEMLQQEGVLNVGVVSNPEFFIEGKAVESSVRPDRVVVGAWHEQDFAIMRQVHQRFYDSPTVKYIEVNPKEAAASKLLANFYLFNKLALCYDVMGRTCEVFPELKFENIRRVLTTDQRLGEWGFFDSLYAGGSCLIKDTRSLSYQLNSKGKQAVMVDEAYSANRRQLEQFFTRAEKEGDIEWSGKTVAVLGLSFKRDTNDIRNAPSVDIVRWLFEKKVGRLQLYDPVAEENFKKLFPENSQIIYADQEVVACAGAEVIIITTDWPQFRSLGDYLFTITHKPLIMDGRRMLQHHYTALQKVGYTIIAVGSPLLPAII